jgi:hypothetical protein
MAIDARANELPLEEIILKRIPKEILGLSLMAAIVTAFLFGIGTAFFVLAGGILSAVNFIWLNRILSRILLREKRKAVKTSGMFFGLRLVLIIAVFFIIIFFFSNRIIAFAVGFSSIIVVLLFEAVNVMSRLKTWKN